MLVGGGQPIEILQGDYPETVAFVHGTSCTLRCECVSPDFDPQVDRLGRLGVCGFNADRTICSGKGFWLSRKGPEAQDVDESAALSVLKSVDCNPSSYALTCIDTHTAADVEIVSCKLSARPRKLSAQPSCHFPACKSDTTLSSFPFLCKPRLSSAHSRRFLWVRRLTGLPPRLSCDMRGARLCEVGYRCRRQRACAACGGGCAEW